MPTLPTTTYLVDSLKELYIQNSDPSQMGDDPIAGLREKENDLKNITVESLIESMGEAEYIEAENQIANTSGAGFASILLGLTTPSSAEVNINISDLYTNNQLSSSSSQYDEYIFSNTTYYFSVEITGGDVSFDSYEYEWITQQNPDGGIISFDLISDVINTDSRVMEFSISFSEIGSYLYRLKVTNTIHVNLQSYQSQSTDVVTLYTLTKGTHSNGDITGNFGVQISGTVIELTAVPNGGYYFAGWTGDIDGDLANVNPTFILMDSDKTINSLFTNTAKTLVVTSDHGDPSPDIGTNYYTYNESVTCSVDEEVLSPAGDIKYVSVGWTGTGNIPSIGVTYTIPAFNITQNSTLNWVWKTQNKLVASAGTGGSVDAYITWHDITDVVTLTTTPIAGYTFNKWTDSISGLTVTMPLTMSQPYNVVATFTKNDQYIPTAVPIGGIIMYSGALTTSYFDATGLGVNTLAGWALCNGNNTAPNLSGKFIVGYDSTVTDGIIHYTTSAGGVINSSGITFSGRSPHTNGSYVINVPGGTGGKLNYTVVSNIITAATLNTAGTGYPVSSSLTLTILGYDAIGNTGGESNHIILTEEMPAHNHGGTKSVSISVSISGTTGSNDNAGDLIYSNTKRGTEDGNHFLSSEVETAGDGHSHSFSGSGSGSGSITIDSNGSGYSQENRPPYYVLAYIKRVS